MRENRGGEKVHSSSLFVGGVAIVTGWAILYRLYTFTLLY